MRLARLIVGLLGLVALAKGCGIIVHTELVRRAQTSYNDPTFGNGFVAQVLANHPGAAQAGAPFPDTMYDGLCAEGRYHQISEDVHWGEYQVKAWEYFQETYPDPTNDPKAQTLMSFLLGVASHSVADIGWHNLSGLKDGLIQMLADTSFDGVYNSAHHFADIGGDIVGMELWNASFHRDWVVPSEDLYNIFQKYYGKEVIAKDLLEGCITEMYAVRELERLAGSIIYPIFTQTSSIFQDELEGYFEGGMNDMTSWTRLLWDQLLYIGKHGSEGCTTSTNPMKIQCMDRHIKVKQDSHSPRNMVHKKSKKNFLLDLFNINARELASFAQTGRDSSGHFNVKVDTETLYKKMSQQPFTKYLEELSFLSLEDIQRRKVASLRHPAWSFPPSAVDSDNFTAFARIGEAVIAQDVDGDNIGDLIISAPGQQTSVPENPGCVYLITTKAEPKTICSPEGDIYGSFGHSLAVANGPILYVGAPTLGIETASYTGRVYGFDLNKAGGESPDKVMSSNDDETLTDTFGWTLASATSGDTVFVGSRHQTFASTHQSGSVSSVLDGSAKIKGIHRYDWTGTAILGFSDTKGRGFVAVGSPNYALTVADGCRDSDCPLLSAGKVEIRDAQTMDLVKTVYGTTSFESFGSSLATGQARYTTKAGEKKTVLIVGSPTFSYHDGIYDHRFAGAVTVLSADDFEPLTVVRGTEANGHFGKSVAVAPNSGRVIAGAPNEGASHKGHLGPGKVYVFNMLEEGTLDATSAEEMLSPPEISDRGQQFGAVVAISPNEQIIVSAPKKRVGDKEQVGKVYLYNT